MDIKQILQGIKSWINNNYYDKNLVDQLLSAIGSVNCYEVCAELPNEGEGNVIYLLGPTGSGNDKYEEYVYPNSTTGWVKIGDTSIDLSGYVTNTALNTALADYTLSINIPVEKGTGTNSVQQKIGNISIQGTTVSGSNKAISNGSFSEGVLNNSGTKGVRWTNINFDSEDTDTITLEIPLTTQIPAGIYISIINKNHYDHCAYLSDTAVVGATSIIVTKLPFTLIETDSGYDAKTLIFEGYPEVGNIDLGQTSHSEGCRTNAVQMFSHSEGYGTQAIGQYSHAEGRETKACYSSHSEGRRTEARGSQSHAEGRDTIASGQNSHTEGQGCISEGNRSHSEGYFSKASGDSSHAEGNNSIANGNYAHAEGWETKAVKTGGHAEGRRTTASGYNAHSEGGYMSDEHGRLYLTSTNDPLIYNYTCVYWAQPILNSTTKGGVEIVAFTSINNTSGTVTLSETLGELNNSAVFFGCHAKGSSSHAEGAKTVSLGAASHSEGFDTVAAGNYSHSEGQRTNATGNISHAEGYQTKANNTGTHAEGYNTTAIGLYSHVEGKETIANEQGSHAEGNNTKAMAIASHAEGFNTEAVGDNSHAEGSNTEAVGDNSHAEGSNTFTSNIAEHAEGQFNQSHLSVEAFGDSGNTHHSVGIGTSYNNRKNAFEIMQNGEIYICGVGGYDGTNPTPQVNSLQKVLEGLGITIDWTKL